MFSTVFGHHSPWMIDILIAKHSSTHLDRKLQPCVVDGANTCPPRVRSSALPAPVAGERAGTVTSEAQVAHEPGVADLSAPHTHGILSHVDVGCAMFGQMPLLPTGGLCGSDNATTRWFGGVAYREPRSTVTVRLETLRIVETMANTLSLAHAHDEGPTISSDPAAHACLPTWPSAIHPTLAARS
ncbi:hypothetical protein FISHEDRAFT_73752 [Fistulina hepatica ATCC 64428]|uniref:Uncharacterized protein n=1 Tax=Fistulina hepatica ATCC 64428 TaxID=1128425 RepID=A0A0D7ACP8_9AGAR|nr:hypothetical protein FISHEDRAFT_73752 [Fistulina hepatica ATCC 64428]